MPNSSRAMVLLIVLSGLIISMCMGMRQSLGLFMSTMTAAVGISAASFGFAIALQNIVLGVAQPFVGALADRHGARPVLIATALLYAAGLVLMAYPRAFPAGLEIGGILIGVGTAGCAFGVLIGTITRATPPERRSQTVGIVAAAGSLGTLVLAPVGQALIDNFGWQGALFAFAALGASMALLALPIREPAAHAAIGKPQGLGEALRDAMGHRGYLFMTLAFFACGFQRVLPTTHLPASLCACDPRCTASPPVYPASCGSSGSSPACRAAGSATASRSTWPRATWRTRSRTLHGRARPSRSASTTPLRKGCSGRALSRQGRW